VKLIVALLLVITGAWPGITSAQTSVASPAATEECVVTKPVKTRPAATIDPFPPDAALYYEDGIWVKIPATGVYELSPADTINFGPLIGWRSTEVQWLRDDGVEGFITVSGMRLDQPLEDSPQTPLSPQRQYVKVGPVRTGLAFPSDGCWEVTGTVGDHSITFVVDVRFGETSVASPNPG